jgi:hypothetical protein
MVDFQTREHRVRRPATSGYTLYVPPPEERFEQAPVWAAERDPVAGGRHGVRLAKALRETRSTYRRVAMFKEHLSALRDWTRLAEHLLEEDSPHADARQPMGVALVDFAAQAVAVMTPGGPVPVHEGLQLSVLKAVADATLMAGAMFARVGSARR